jgi:hypothetical protein
MADFVAEPIDPALARKLDAFTVSALPEGFAARAAAAALALPQDEAALPPLPRQRRALSRRWLGRGLGGLGVIAAGMLSISAAAMGYFGEPVREAVGRAPVIGKMIERVIPEHLRHRERHVQLAAHAEKPVIAPSASALPEMPLPLEAMPPFMGSRRFASPEERRAWMGAHPVQAARIVERRREWAETHPVQAARRARRRAWAEAHPIAAARLAERHALRMEMQRRRREAAMIGPGRPDQAMPIGPGPGPRQLWRLERRERLRQWRAERRRMLESERSGPQQ